MSGQEFAALLRDHHTVLETAAADTGIIKSRFDRNRVTRNEGVRVTNGERRLFVDIVTQSVARAVEGIEGALVLAACPFTPSSTPRSSRRSASR